MINFLIHCAPLLLAALLALTFLGPTKAENLTVTPLRGPTGSTGPSGPIGATGPAAVGAGVAVSTSFGTAQQATDPTKPSLVCAVLQTVYTITVAGTAADTDELRWGSNQTTVANGTSGVAVQGFSSSLTGIALSIGMGTISRSQLCALIPAGYYWALRRISGTTATIIGVTDQSLG